MTSRASLESTFVELADTLVEDFDVVELLSMLADRCVVLLEVGAAGLMLADEQGELRLVAWSSDRIKSIEQDELRRGEGPALECFRTAAAIVGYEFGVDDPRWPDWESRAVAAGFLNVSVFPLKRGNTVIGTLDLFRRRPGPMPPEDVGRAQALAAVATIAILQHWASEEAAGVNAQLRVALESRVLIEQAKGIVSASRGWNLDQAFSALRAHARANNLRLRDVASEVTDGTIDPGVLGPAPTE